MKILLCSPTDVDTILNLYDQATAYQKTKYTKHWQGFERSLVKDSIDEDRQWKIIIDNQIACVFTLTYNDLLIWKEKDADPALYIHRIATNPDFRGKSLVKIIVAWAKNHAKQLQKDYIRMDTGSGNEGLNKYYVSCGFRYLGVTEMGEAADLPAHYKNGSFSLFEIKVDNRVKIAKTIEDLHKCTEAVLALRPHLSPEKFVNQAHEMLKEGYQLAYIEENNAAVAIIGFRYLQFLYCGKHFYIDDLSTLPACRGKGYGGILLDFVADKARLEGFEFITLDSGHQRTVAHRLYLNKGFIISAHHFTKKL
jgi:ribosomal protein S18 acetylase RimI-like enzyme